MNYKVTHTTTYDYSDPVAVCQNELHLTPRSGRNQTLKYHRLTIHPNPSDTGKRTDYFGNAINYFAINVSHRRLRVTSVSRVSVNPSPLPKPAETPAWETVRDTIATEHGREALAAYQFVFDSPHVTRSSALGQYALSSFTVGKPIMQAAMDFTKRIHADFKYDPTATTVSTPIEEVFDKRRGVCQDLSHVQIGCLRAIGLPARYVSGYLRTIPPAGEPKLVGADASHAWLSVYCGPCGWIDMDPTNDVVPTTDHITVAWGRDYGDVCPINGMFVGGGKHKMTVAVNVEPLP